jgi:hypothetical protein
VFGGGVSVKSNPIVSEVDDGRAEDFIVVEKAEEVCPVSVVVP